MPQNVIPSDSPPTLDVVKSLSTLEQKAIVRPNNPPPGIAGFLFDIVGDEWVELQSDITDHFVEDNTAINDQIALRPEQVTVRGIVAELTNAGAQPDAPIPPINPLPTNIPLQPQFTPASLTSQLAVVGTTAARTGVAALVTGSGAKGVVRSVSASLVASAQSRVSDALLAAIRTLLDPTNAAALLVPNVALPVDAQNAVNVINSLAPKSSTVILAALKTPTVPSSQQLVSTAFQSVNNANNPDSSLAQVYAAKQPTQPNQTKQSSAFLYFYNLWKSRQLFSVETAWGVWTNMAILSIRTEQPEDTRFKSDFTVTFKKVRLAAAATVSLGQLAGRAVSQYGASAPTQNGNLGQQQLTDQDKGVLIYNMGHGP